MIANYHTHTRWCRHGHGEIEDYILQAIRCGLKEICISEHVPLDEHNPLRLHMNELKAYDTELNQMIKKYEDQIHVIKGFECEYYPHRMEYYQYLKKELGYEIFILGQHNSIDETIDYFRMTDLNHIFQYTDELIQGIKTGFFSFCAHPDMILSCYKIADDSILDCMKRIFEACVEMDLPVEINANGMRTQRGYPNRKVWELSKQYPLRYLIGSDAHEVTDLVEEGVQQCELMAKELKIELMPCLK